MVVQVNRVSRRGFLLGAGGVAAGLFVTACSGDTAPTSTSSTAQGLTIAHKFGTTTVPAAPMRVVSVGYNDHDAILALGTVPVGTLDWYGDKPSGVWPWAQDLLGGASPAIIGDAATGIDIEKVANLAPDLILGTYSGLSQTQYRQLSELAPTVAQPAEFADWGVPWQYQAMTVGDALGQTDKAQRLVTDIDDAFDAARAAHPQFAGKKVVVGALSGPGQFGIYGAADPKVRFLNNLGFTNPVELDQIPGNFGPISTEQLTAVDVDLLVWYAGGGYGEKLRAALEQTPVYQSLPVVQAGRALILEDDAAEAMSWSTVLSLRYALEQLPGRLADLVQ